MTEKTAKKQLIIQFEYYMPTFAMIWQLSELTTLSGQVAWHVDKEKLVQIGESMHHE